MTLRRFFAYVGAGLLVLAGVVACSSPRKPDAFVRVDQLGYLPGETKTALLLAPHDATGARAVVVGADGDKVLDLALSPTLGAWNAAFGDLRRLDLTALTKPGTYRVRVEGELKAESPPFRIAAADSLFAPVVRDAVGYFQAHRDGADQVSTAWGRQPAHLADKQATVYENPDFDDDSRLTGPLSPTGGPVDVEGGWYDAGDFLKFTHTTAYAVIALLLVQRDLPGAGGTAVEARHGLDWLDKMWDPATKTLYTQVGIGSGRDGEFLGDHDTWRLPEADDQLNVQAGDSRYYQRHRPVFRAGAPGDELSPNLAGRVATAFALAAQVEAATDPARAKAYLSAAADVFALARTDDVGDLVTSEPRAYYPESSWTDDLAAGATELAFAGRALGDPRSPDWLRQAAHWAQVNTGNDGDAALSVYDLSALADTELARALTTLPPVAGLEIDGAGLRADLGRRLDVAVAKAGRNKSGAAAGNGGSDYAARELGYAASAELYDHAFGGSIYAAFGTAQRNVVLGANGWGTSMVIGTGSTWPRCPHDQIASLARPGQALTGAVVNGPNTAARVEEIQDGEEPSSCSSDALDKFDRDDAYYTDDTRVSATTEPSIDFTATGLLAFALLTRRQ